MLGRCLCLRRGRAIWSLFSAACICGSVLLVPWDTRDESALQTLKMPNPSCPTKGVLSVDGDIVCCII
eukprot:1908164-Amphidinium_carterae.1